MTRFMESAKASREQLGRDLAANGLVSLYSPAEYSLRRVLLRHLETHAHGSVLDAGCGAMPYKRAILELADSYTSMDFTASTDVDIQADVMDMPQVADSTFDLVLSSEVIEHVPRPVDAVREMARVLREDGVLLLSSPHLSRIHEAPNDYFRYTRYGLEELAASAGLEVVELEPVGSVFSLLGHQLVSALVVPFWRYRGLRWIVLTIAVLVVTVPALILDRIPGMKTLLPLNMVLVARKRARS